MQAIHFLLGKAGVQLLAPAALYLGLGLLLLNSGWLLGNLPGCSHSWPCCKPALECNRADWH